MFELKPLICKCCGGKIDRKTMTCPYCNTQYEFPDGRIKIVVDRPGVHTIRSETKVDMMHMRNSPERVTQYVLRDMREQIADSLLAYMKITTSETYDPMNCCQIIRGEIRVLDPSFDHAWNRGLEDG